MPRIIQVYKNSQGEIEKVKLDDGRTIKLEEAIAEAENGIIKGVFVGRDKQGRKYLRVKRDDDLDENIDNLSLI